MPIPLPPLLEQLRLTSHIEDAVMLEKKQAKSLGETSNRIRRLRQAILKWAFEGKLVDQDPNDEPVSALLDRIKADRSNSSTLKKTTTRGRRKATARKS